MSDEQARLEVAVKYLQYMLKLMAGYMNGEANRMKGLDFYKWRRISHEVCANADRIVQGFAPNEVEFRESIDDILEPEYIPRPKDKL